MDFAARAHRGDLAVLNEHHPGIEHGRVDTVNGAADNRDNTRGQFARDLIVSQRDPAGRDGVRHAKAYR